MYQMMLNRKNSKKGFTLVEVIVVLVILAILAAIMIPAMTGWIDEAKEKKVFVNARTALLAAQTIESEAYGAATTYAAKTDATLATTDTTYARLIGTSGVQGITYSTDAKAQITKAEYTEGITLEYTLAGGWVKK